ncbi:hypothetical protein ShzoTeo12_35710 (plasmid) [Shinella zoogloeoides]|nr:hypothetical protein ShzoTeo12_35710 [Shinella zoogloeoides]
MLQTATRAKRRGSSFQCCPARTYVSFPQSRARQFARQAEKTRVRAHVGSLLHENGAAASGRTISAHRKTFRESPRKSHACQIGHLAQEFYNHILAREHAGRASGAYLTEDGRCRTRQILGRRSRTNAENPWRQCARYRALGIPCRRPDGRFVWPSLDEEERYQCKEAVPPDLDRGAPGGAKTEKPDCRRERFTASRPHRGEGWPATMRSLHQKLQARRLELVSTDSSPSCHGLMELTVAPSFSSEQQVQQGVQSGWKVRMARASSAFSTLSAASSGSNQPRMRCLRSGQCVSVPRTRSANRVTW